MQQQPEPLSVADQIRQALAAHGKLSVRELGPHVSATRFEIVHALYALQRSGQVRSESQMTGFHRWSLS